MTHVAGLSHFPGQIVGVGCDVVHLPTMRRQVTSDVGPRFLANTFTDFELSRCAGDPRRLAQYWAGKEAVAKAIGSGAENIGLRQIELQAVDIPHSDQDDVTRDGVMDVGALGSSARAGTGGDSEHLRSRWVVRAPGHEPWPGQAHEWSWLLSVSGGNDYVFAVAIASRSAGTITTTPGGDDTKAGALRSTVSVSQDRHPRSSR
jgi:phosphopantetheinyl transferase (holo-ACP synthase)